MRPHVQKHQHGSRTKQALPTGTQISLGNQGHMEQQLKPAPQAQPQTVPGGLKAPPGHPLGAHLPPLFELHHLPTPHLGTIKSKGALFPPDLGIFPGSCFGLFLKQVWNKCSSTCKCLESPKGEAPGPGSSDLGSPSVLTQFSQETGSRGRKQFEQPWGGRRKGIPLDGVEGISSCVCVPEGLWRQGTGCLQAPPPEAK